MKNKFLISTLSLALASSSLLVLPVSAATEDGAVNKTRGTFKEGQHFGRFNHNKMAHGLFGTVESVNGSVFTVNMSLPFHASSTTAISKIFTINTDNETVFKKDGQDSTVADLVIGAKVMVRGEVNTSTMSVAADNVNLITKLPDKINKDSNKTDTKKFKGMKNFKRPVKNSTTSSNNQ